MEQTVLQDGGVNVIVFSDVPVRPDLGTALGIIPLRAHNEAPWPGFRWLARASRSLDVRAFGYRVAKRAFGFVLQNMQGNNTGDDIPALNASYSELTGLYWLWKNCDAQRHRGVLPKVPCRLGQPHEVDVRARVQHVRYAANLFDAYCAWLFPLLEALGQRIDTSDMDSFTARWPGRASGRMLDPWLVHGISYAELSVVSPEPVDWVKKSSSFLAAKFLGKKYVRSF